MDLETRLRRFFRRWYRECGRAFPWRDPGVTPFGTLIAEMLLRQTRAEMVAALWPTFLERYPTPAACAAASDEELYAFLAPLGLGRQRAEAIRLTSQSLLERHGGAVPRSIDALLELPHIGLYSAHAVACFAYGRRVPVVDVNVIRLFSRLTGQAFSRDNRRAPEAWALAWRILPDRAVREHNYGILDFAATVCKPSSPAHDTCPLAPYCMGFMKGAT